MRYFILLTLFFCVNAYASTDDMPDFRSHGIVIAIMPEDGTEEMYEALANEGLNGYAQLVLMRHAKLESEYGTKGVAMGNGFNWWNQSCSKKYKGKKRIAYEFEHGRRVKKYWKIFDTPQEAAREQIKFLRRRYRGALTEASRGNWKGYLRVLRKGGYFGKV